MGQSNGIRPWSIVMTRVKKHCLPLAALIFAATSLTAHAQQGVQINTENGLVSVQASNTTANELAAALAQALGISVVITGDTETRVNIDIIEEPLEKALTKLDLNNMLVRADSRPDSDIIEVVLLMGNSANSSAAASQFLPSGSPADEIIPLANQEALFDGDDDMFSIQNRGANARPVTDTPSNAAIHAGAGNGIDRDQPVDLPSGEMFDPATGMPIDPSTGKSLQPEQDQHQPGG